MTIKIFTVTLGDLCRHSIKIDKRCYNHSAFTLYYAQHLCYRVIKQSVRPAVRRSVCLSVCPMACSQGAFWGYGWLL